jgi:hypothetical protein
MEKKYKMSINHNSQNYISQTTKEMFIDLYKFVSYG